MNRDLFDPLAVVRPAEDLATLAHAINAEHEAAESALREGLAHARAAGELLVKAKGQCPHGQWLPWLKGNVRFSERTAQAYMRVAREWDTLTAKAQHVADLSYRDGLKLLAAPEPAAPESAAPEPAEVALSIRMDGDVLVMTKTERGATVAEVRVGEWECQIFGTPMKEDLFRLWTHIFCSQMASYPGQFWKTYGLMFWRICELLMSWYRIPRYAQRQKAREVAEAERADGEGRRAGG
jgi:Protein of unknown function (DUF3102)